MKLDDFAQLPETVQLDLLYEQGVYLGKRKTGATTVVLYQLEGFYAEIYYRRYRQVVDRVYCFSGTRSLDPYLTGIHIEQFTLRDLR